MRNGTLAWISSNHQASRLSKYAFSSFSEGRETSLLAPFLQSKAMQIKMNPLTSRHFVDFEHPASDQNQTFSY